MSEEEEQEEKLWKYVLQTLERSRSFLLRDVPVLVAKYLGRLDWIYCCWLIELSLCLSGSWSRSIELKLAIIDTTSHHHSFPATDGMYISGANPCTGCRILTLSFSSVCECLQIIFCWRKITFCLPIAPPPPRTNQSSATSPSSWLQSGHLCKACVSSYAPEQVAPGELTIPELNYEEEGELCNIEENFMRSCSDLDQENWKLSKK